jgi:hypothetical protein
VFVQHLVITDSLKRIIDEDIPSSMLPTEDLRPLVDFAYDYWFTAGSFQAPSPDAMRTMFANVIVEHEIDLDVEPDDHVDFAISTLRQSWIDRQWQQWLMPFASQMEAAPLDQKSEKLNEAIGQLMAMSNRIAPASEQVDVRFGMQRALERYEARVAMRALGQVDGLIFGFEQIDTHTSGIRPGELAIVASPPKTGKSWLLLNSAYKNWLAGGVPVLHSLENSVDLTLDRLACMALGIDARRWQRGECTEIEVLRVREWIRQFQEDQARFDRPFYILQPEMGKRSIQHLVRRAQTMGDSLFIDQLSFVEPSPETDRRPREQQIGYILHQLKALTSGSMATVLAHQINREGVRMAEKAGRLEMYHLADSAEVERTADWAFGLWQSRALRDVNFMQMQSLAARREDLIHWELAWQPWVGIMNVRGVVDLSATT